MTNPFEQLRPTKKAASEIIMPEEQLGVKAYAFLQSEPFNAPEVVRQLNEMPEVTEANVCVGSVWNIAAILHTQTTRELREVYHGRILQIPEITAREELILVIG